MSAIERCRSAQLGGHRLHCDACGTDTIAYNSCRNRHCPKCQASAAERWLRRQQADLLPVPYFHVVFTLPDLGAKPGITAVLHTWGSNLSFHPHLHCIVTGGGLRRDQWIRSRRRFFLPVKVLSRYFRHRFVAALRRLYDNGELNFFGDLKVLEDPDWFEEHLRPLRKTEWIVYAKAPFAGPQAVLTYLSRYTHRIAISNRRLVSFNDRGVTFRYKDYRNGKTRWRSMTVSADELMRRFLQHVLPRGFHRIRHYGLLANAQRNDNLSRARSLLTATTNETSAPTSDNETNDKDRCTFTCRACGEPLIVIEILLPQHAPRAPPQEIAA
jgi:hypothetical protein